MDKIILLMRKMRSEPKQYDPMSYKIEKMKVSIVVGVIVFLIITIIGLLSGAIAV